MSNEVEVRDGLASAPQEIDDEVWNVNVDVDFYWEPPIFLVEFYWDFYSLKCLSMADTRTRGKATEEKHARPSLHHNQTGRHASAAGR